MKKESICLSLTLMLLAIQCAPKVAPAKTAETPTVDRLAEGKILYENSCKKCHDLPNPTDYTSVEWVGIMNAMAPKAKLNDDQHRLVYDYVVSVKK